MKKILLFLAGLVLLGMYVFQSTAAPVPQARLAVERSLVEGKGMRLSDKPLKELEAPIELPPIEQNVKQEVGQEQEKVAIAAKDDAEAEPSKDVTPNEAISIVVNLKKIMERVVKLVPKLQKIISGMHGGLKGIITSFISEGPSLVIDDIVPIGSAVSAIVGDAKKLAGANPTAKKFALNAIDSFIKSPEYTKALAQLDGMVDKLPGILKGPIKDLVKELKELPKTAINSIVK